MKGQCCYCGRIYTMTKEEEEMKENGFLEREICNECLELEEEAPDFDYMEISDSDPCL